MLNKHYKLNVDAIRFSAFNHKDECEYLATKCNTDDYCTVGYLSCPFIGKRCENITTEDWMNVLEPSENNNV